MKFFFPNRRIGGPDPVTAAKSLFFGTGPLARYPGPAAVLRDDGAVLVANTLAWDRMRQLGLAGSAPLAPGLAEAIASGRPEFVSVSWETGKIELEVLPLEQGGPSGGPVALVLGRELAVTQALHDALAESRARYKALVELSSEFAWETGPDGNFVFVSPRGALGYEASELVGRAPDSFAAAPNGDPTGPSPFAARARVAGVTVWWRRKDGREACLLVSALPVHPGDAVWRGARGVCRDVTEERAREAALAALRQREDLLAYLVRVMRDALTPQEMLSAAAAATAQALGARACRIHRVNANGAAAPAASFGPPSEAGAEAMLIGRIARSARSEGGSAAMTDGATAVTETGSARQIARPAFYRRAMIGVVFLERAADAPPWSAEDRALLGGIANQLGIALAQASHQAELERLSRTDPLTGLLNRRAFEGDLTARLARRGGHGAPGALVQADLDNFKPVNDVHGHERGDGALVAVAELLLARTRPGDLVARVGGDEFALWLERIEPDDAAKRAAELIAASGKLHRFSADAARPLGFSLGVALHRPESGENYAALSARADAAMYEAKREGKGRFRLDGEAAPQAVTRPLRVAGADGGR